MLHPSEWLKEAKQLPVGRTKRTYHGAEKRPNLVIRNTDTGWSAYCHSCHDKGYVAKEFVKVLEVAPVVRKASGAGFLRSLNLETDLNIPYSDISLFLHKKGMSLQYIQHLDPKWSAQDKRIVLTTKQQVLGRDITGFSPSKWWKYSGDYSYVLATDKPLQDKVVVLTEDLFSACKGQYFAPENVVFIAVTGTRIQDELLVQLTKVKQVVMLLDGDAAGDAGTTHITRTLRLIGVPHRVVRLPNGCDPKDMSPEWWTNFNTAVGAAQ